MSERPPKLGELTRFTDMSADAPIYKIGDRYFDEDCGFTYEVIEKLFLFNRFGYDIFSYTAKIVDLGVFDD